MRLYSSTVLSKYQQIALKKPDIRFIISENERGIKCTYYDVFVWLHFNFVGYIITDFDVGKIDHYTTIDIKISIKDKSLEFDSYSYKEDSNSINYYIFFTDHGWIRMLRDMKQYIKIHKKKFLELIAIK